MISIRRYAVYLGLAACIIFTLTYYRDGLLRNAAIGPLSQVPFTSQSGKNGGSSSASRSTWKSYKQRYPVDHLTPLPRAAPKRLPKVQHSFAKETFEDREKRHDRQSAVKAVFVRCWRAYREHAWTQDELSPISGGYRNGFGGWAASLVDNLDNLWIMGLKSDFEDAVKATMELDLSTSSNDMVNVFETTIRHLGGLLSAYDLSGDQRLLEKAKEFGEMLLVPFDTPNRMPITRWYPKKALSEPQVADQTVLVAEIGSLSMEFTRLSQVTGDARWYDAVVRINKVFDEQQNQTHLPGMWPVSVDARNKDFKTDTFFTLSAMSDSLYEYFPKMHALLGGVEPVYKKFYDSSMATAIRFNLWRPMTPDNADILISGNVRASGTEPARLDPQGQHLVCFAGGMFALGGKLFDQPAHVEIGKKLTDGCIWTYKNMPMGIMPEIFNMVPCESRLECQWDEKKWHKDIMERKPGKGDAGSIIKDERLAKGFTEMSDRRYILRPEAIESVFILYRITGEEYLLDAAWDMFNATVNATQTPLANAALADISYEPKVLASQGIQIKFDSMESFWMAETLKYFYLIFSEPDVISLDEWVFNTEAHAFKRP